MRLGVRFGIAFAIVLATAGCARLPVAPPLAASLPDEYFPLHPGTLWVYEVRDALGRIALERVLVRGTYRLTTHGTDATVVEESGGMTGEFDLDVSWHPVVYYRRGVFLYKFSGVNFAGGEVRELPLGEGEEKVLPDDPTAEHQWESDFEIFRNGPDTDYRASLLSVANPSLETVSVRAGTFHRCLRVESQTMLASRAPRAPVRYLSFHYTDWYAPGVGLVRSEARLLDRPKPVTTFELLSFRDGIARD